MYDQWLGEFGSIQSNRGMEGWDGRLKDRTRDVGVQEGQYNNPQDNEREYASWGGGVWTSLGAGEPGRGKEVEEEVEVARTIRIDRIRTRSEDVLTRPRQYQARYNARPAG